MIVSPEKRIEALSSVVKLLQWLVIEKDSQKDDIAEKFEFISTELAALKEEYFATREYNEKRGNENKSQIQILRRERDDALRAKEKSDSKTIRAIQQARTERYYRQLVEDESRGLSRQIKAFTSSYFALEIVDDTQICPSCGEQQLDRDVDDTCVCRYCMSRFAMDLEERRPF